ncbi:MAG: hypothetical protein HY525_13160, partial [Betaproteobacteria bacterium]|nr:hypothetical protein [Betaproteobacteria bacterium]
MSSLPPAPLAVNADPDYLGRCGSGLLRRMQDPVAPAVAVTLQQHDWRFEPDVWKYHAPTRQGGQTDRKLDLLGRQHGHGFAPVGIAEQHALRRELRVGREGPRAQSTRGAQLDQLSPDTDNKKRVNSGAWGICKR